MIKRWVNKPARWYNFWLPQSGAVGGIISALFFLIIVSLVYWVACC